MVAYGFIEVTLAHKAVFGCLGRRSQHPLYLAHEYQVSHFPVDFFAPVTHGIEYTSDGAKVVLAFMTTSSFRTDQTLPQRNDTD